MAEGVRELYAAVFGSESDSDEGDGVAVVDSDAEWEPEEELWLGDKRGRRAWQAVAGVDGLWRCEEFLDSAEQTSLVRAIEGERWFEQPSHNQAMRFGALPGWALTLSSLIFSSVSWFVEEVAGLGSAVPLPETILGRTPLFDQMIVNSYQPGEGIGPHVDLTRFEDGIAVLSLLSACVMRFRKCKRPTQNVDVLLSPGDLIMMSGNARYEWTHEINRAQAEEQVWAGKVLEQARRISVTLRRLCPEFENGHPMES